jgi:hypothetical protein
MHQTKENMFRIKTKPTAFAAIILSLGLVATGSASASANEGRTQTPQRGPVYRHVAHRLARPGYAGPAYSVIPTDAWPIAQAGYRFVPSRGIAGESCDLPSSTCPNDERIND